MSVGRLLLATISFFSVSVSQDVQSSSALETKAALPSAIVFTQSQHTDPTEALIAGIARFKVDAYRVIPSIGIVPTASINPVAPHLTSKSSDDSTCYTIRTYVFSRDDKDSDSTHLVGYSTCQPASRYRLRTAAGSAENE